MWRVTLKSKLALLLWFSVLAVSAHGQGVPTNDSGLTVRDIVETGDREVDLATFRLGLIERVGLARVIDARVVDDTRAELFGRIEISQKRYSAGRRPRFWINCAVHRDLRQVCKGDDVADKAAVDQWRCKLDGQICLLYTSPSPRDRG